ncbi:hypothetical protein CMO92_01210 [Candidatus Woesearchaeota archaeon]|nr:hypothetical protein [Candidatus Woesearchaeota archaeon]
MVNVFYTTVELWAVVVAALVSMVLGAAWYSPGMFGKMWIKLSGFTKKDQERAEEEGMGSRYFLGFLSSLVMSFVLAVMIRIVGAGSGVSGAIVGFWLWLGFIATTTLGMVLWERKPFQLYLLNNGYSLMSLLVMGVMLGLWA